MIELFTNISAQFKEQVEIIFDWAMHQDNPYESARILSEFLNVCYNPEEYEFASFYFDMRLEQLKNDSNIDQR